MVGPQDLFNFIDLYIYISIQYQDVTTKKHFSLWKIWARLLSNYIAEFILRVDVCYLVLFCIAQV